MPGDLVAKWERFLCGEPVSVRPEIQASWQRSKAGGVDPERLDLERTEIDPEQTLVRAGAPVMLGMSDQFAGTATALALADVTGTVIWRWEADRRLTGDLDRIEFTLGSRAGERSAGTNGIGIAATTSRTSVVVGAEHFKQAWHGWACVAAPVVDPVGRRIAGSVNIACPAPDANRLLVVAARSLAANITESLRRMATVRQHRLLDAHLAFCASGAGTVVSLDRQHMIVEDGAAPYGLDRAVLWQVVNQAGPAAREVEIAAGVHARMYPVTPGRLDDGVVLLIGRGPVPSASPPKPSAVALTPLEQAEARVIVDVLTECGGNKSLAANRLGISRGTLYQRLRYYRLSDGT